MVDSVVAAVVTEQPVSHPFGMLMKAAVLRRTAVAALACGVLVGACSNSEPANLESLGLAVAADVQAGERFEITAAKDADISVTSVSAPSGVSAVVSEPDGQTVTLVVEVAPETPAGSYTLLLRTDRNGNGAELEWPFDVIEAESDLSEEDPIPAAEAVRDEFVAALAAKDATALRALWPESSWDTLGVDVLDSFIPTEPDAGCQPFDDGRSTCFVFEDGVPRVLGLTLDLTADGWTITAVSLDSTN